MFDKEAPKEEVPNSYRNKHQFGIHLDTYNGIASDVMELNAPVADRFMQVSVMRGDIVVIRKPQDRVLDYDDVGFVRVAKFLKMPRLDFWKGNNLFQVKRENNTWYVAINDQDLANEVARSEDKSKFEDKFLVGFKQELGRGLTSCLKREKLLNSGHYNPAFLTGYISLGFDIPALAAVLAVSVKEPRLLPYASAYILYHIAFVDTFCNLLNWSRSKIIDNNNDPFVKHSFPEFLLPGVPVDRLIRGLYYLEKHGSEMISIHKADKKST